MVIIGKWQSRPVTISMKPNCLTVSVEGETSTDVFSYDYAGRLWTALLDHVSYRRGLDGKMIAKWQAASGERQRRWFLPSEALEIESRARHQIVALFADLQVGKVEQIQPELGCFSPQMIKGFERAIAFDASHSQADAEIYHRVYKPVGILPPDQYMAVVLQATEGCAFNSCTFCDFYKERPFRIKTAEEFKAHALDVLDFIGEGMSLRRTIFLGDANALVTPMRKLLPLLDVTHQVYDVERLGGIYAFLDGFSAGKKSTADYAALAERGLKRVYVGLESGSEPLLKFLNKPGKPGDAIKAVRAMKAGGVAVGVIVLLGAGGKAYARQHIRETIRVINAMQLDLEDIIYFSELVLSEGMQYVRDAYQAQLQPLHAAERLAQADAIEQGLRFSERGGVPHISRYDIREFVY